MHQMLARGSPDGLRRATGIERQQQRAAIALREFDLALSRRDDTSCVRPPFKYALIVDALGRVE